MTSENSSSPVYRGSEPTQPSPPELSRGVRSSVRRWWILLAILEALLAATCFFLSSAVLSAPRASTVNSFAVTKLVILFMTLGFTSLGVAVGTMARLPKD